MPDRCQWGKCNCGVDFTEECPKKLPIVGHEDHEILTNWTEYDFNDSDYPIIDRRKSERRKEQRRSGEDRRGKWV